MRKSEKEKNMNIEQTNEKIKDNVKYILIGMRDFYLTPIYLVKWIFTGPIAECPNCARAKFWHPHALQMNYCHFCGEELIKYEERVI